MVYESCPKLWFLAFVSMLSSAALAKSDSMLDINIYVLSSLGEPNATILLAEEYAGKILAKAGVAVRWLNCPSAGCIQKRSPNDFGFHVTRKMPPETSDGALGFTNSAHPVGGASYSRIEAAAFRRHMTVPPVLGAVMAHEIGHWLLGANAHSPHGIMRGNWGDYEFKLASCHSLTFTSEEKARVRKAAALRLNLSECALRINATR